MKILAVCITLFCFNIAAKAEGVKANYKWAFNMKTEASGWSFMNFKKRKLMTTGLISFQAMIAKSSQIGLVLIQIIIQLSP